MSAYPPTPTERTEYHPEQDFSIVDFGKLWLKEGQPPIQEGWRDPGGGWIRWLWFEDASGHAHALHAPAYRDGPRSTQKEKALLGFFLGWVVKHRGSTWTRSSRVETWLDQKLHEVLLGKEHERTRRELILGTIKDLVSDFMYYERREDEQLPRGAIEEAIGAGEVSPEEMAQAFLIAVKEKIK